MKTKNNAATTLGFGSKSICLCIKYRQVPSTRRWVYFFRMFSFTVEQLSINKKKTHGYGDSTFIINCYGNILKLAGQIAALPPVL